MRPCADERTAGAELIVSMLHLRVVCPAESADPVFDVICDRVGVVAVTRTESTDGPVIAADLAREAADDLLDALRALGVHATGMITLAPVDTAVGDLATRAELAAPGEGADAVIWDQLAARTSEDSTLTWTFLAFMVIATILAAIGVATDSTITLVGAMVVGPEFGPLAALAVGLLRHNTAVARKAAIALVVGFPVAIVVSALFALIARGIGLIDKRHLLGGTETEFIYHPGWLSLIIALVAGAAGMLSITSSKSAALVGVFISVTTIPAAGNAAVAAVFGEWYQAGQSLLQLGINLVGITTAGVLTLLGLERVQGKTVVEASRSG
jgi:uncharacterized hydrophobic protein (TIGR00271 family)